MARKKPERPAGMNYTYPTPFEFVWREYPRKTHKWEAYCQWHVCGFDEDEDANITLRDIIIQRRANDTQWLAGNGRYVPQLERFISARLWEDEWNDLRNEPTESRPVPPPADTRPIWQQNGAASEDAYRQRSERAAAVEFDKLREILPGVLH